MLAMPHNQTLRERNDALGNPVQCVTWFDRQLAGFSHLNRNGIDRLPLIKNLTRGCKLVLVPEADNQYDRNAILIYSADDLENDIGYLDSTGAKYIAPLIERGATFRGEVFDVWFQKPNVPNIRIMVYQLTPTPRKQRPVRKDAPVYVPEPRFAVHKDEAAKLPPSLERIQIQGNHEPAVVQLTQLEPEGIWSRFKQFLGF
jgi:hypothetical protein